MGLLNRKKQQQMDVQNVQTYRDSSHPFSSLNGYIPLVSNETRLYESIREAVPIIDAAIMKIVRLVGGFDVECDNVSAQRMLKDFYDNVPIGASSKGMESFVAGYLENLLTYGNAVGEIVLSGDQSRVAGLYHASLENIEVKEGKTPLEADIFVRNNSFGLTQVKNTQLVLFSALNPPAAKVTGVSILKSLPFVTEILLRIFQSVGQNFDRVGNVRFAVTYKPSGDSLDKSQARERAMQIASEWSDGMNACKNGQVKDFVAVGDVDIKVIGADNQIIDTQIPVRQMLEQIVAKLSIPPFLLGLNWSTSERMSKQQADILTSELEYYRRILTPTVLKICRTFLRINGYTCEPRICWNTINLQDEIEGAKARLYNAQAQKLENENQINQHGGGVKN
ncbi:MAG: hypothetical protein K0R90_576 [Oscillospiraceae bacterium]|nr:hypothetical protein [Oscillospiraceae bacterium]